MEAIEKLKLLTAWDLEPVLSEAELGEALANYAIADSQAFAPVNEEWSPTYNLNAVEAHAWNDQGCPGRSYGRDRSAGPAHRNIEGLRKLPIDGQDLRSERHGERFDQITHS